MISVKKNCKNKNFLLFLSLLRLSVSIDLWELCSFSIYVNPYKEKILMRVAVLIQ